MIYSTISGDEGYTSGPLFEMEQGPVHLNISNLKIEGRGTSKGCFYLEADAASGSTEGGLFFSTFKNIYIHGFNGHGIYLKAPGYITSQTPKLNQLCTFENVYVNRQVDEINALKIEGYAGQLTFINCGFGGEDMAVGGRFRNGSAIDIKSVTITNPPSVNVNNSSIISFINCTISASDYGANINFAENITFDNCWFENTGIGLNVMGTANNPSRVNVLNSRFSNAAGFGALNPLPSGNTTSMGRCINVVDSFVNVLNNYVQVSDPSSTSINDDYFVVANDFTNIGVNMQGNSFQSQKLNRALGITSLILESSYNSTNILNCRKNKVNYAASTSTTVPSASVVKQIDADFNVGETIFIRANGGNVSFWDASKTGSIPGKNIFLSSAATAAPSGVLTLKNGEAAVFTKVEENVYQLTSIIRGTSN